jgi:putative membrane protein
LIGALRSRFVPAWLNFGGAVITYNKRLLAGLLVIWYLLLSLWTAYAPADRQFWLLSSILPGLLVLLLIGTHRLLPLSAASYVLITLFLTLHMIGARYTYAEVPAGAWLEQALPLGRNHYDRIVHFCFGVLLTYPIEELFRLTVPLRGWLLYYLPVMTVLGLSGLWEIVESWVARAVHPELGITYLGSQGDVWDAQKDMAAAMYGALLCTGLLLLYRRPRLGRSVAESSR